MEQKIPLSGKNSDRHSRRVCDDQPEVISIGNSLEAGRNSRKPKARDRARLRSHLHVSTSVALSKPEAEDGASKGNRLIKLARRARR
jgi:hypothetical protein